ncbi:MAG: thioredoxin domain-containing protein [Myxococcota bacterium]
MSQTPQGWSRGVLPALAVVVLLAAGCKSDTRMATHQSTTASPRPDAAGALALPPPAKGAAAPLAVVTLFTDFECPYCREMAPAMTRLVETWPDAVQVQFRHMPLSFHGLAEAAARASVAAQLQGRFAEMHDLLFRRQSEWSALADVAALEAWTLREASALGMDGARFAVDMAAPETAARVEADAAKGRALELPGTPSVLVGARLADATAGIEGILNLVRDEVARGQTRLGEGVSRPDVPAALALAESSNSRVADWLIRDLPMPDPAADDAADDPAGASNASPLKTNDDPGRAVPEQRWEVPVRADDPARGPQRAPVTLVLFEDVQCPFCAAFVPTLDRLLERYPKTVRLVVKHLPLPFHPAARPAALALECARQRDQFWPLHDRLVANRDRLSPGAIVEHSAALGLTDDAFARCLVAPETAARVDEDIALAERVGARGTPVLYINGRKMAGSRPLPELSALIDAELEHAKRVARDTLDPYPAIIAGAAALNPLAQQAVELNLADAPRRGPADATVRLVLFNDLACAPCRVVGRAVADQATAAPAPGEATISVHVRPFIPQGDASADLAARAVFCAGRQALFWPVHDALNRLGVTVRDDVLAAAKEAGADVDALGACLDDATTDTAVARATAEAKSLGVDQAPTLFVDGRRYDGSLGFGPRALHRLIRAGE